MKKTAKEIRIELAQTMIEKYVESVGLTKEETYDPVKNVWRWRHGSANIEVFVQSVNVGQNSTREYLRVFSLLGEVPQASLLVRERFLIRLLEMNDVNLGVKLTVMKDTDKVYATYERDIMGMDFGELSTCIADLEWWADKLDDEIRSLLN
ncbi:MAG: YbjN domain-containing protein [Microscillaceae bacterium]|nr:YbjN domain-containing protein [Microscillaceae bacterium]MDW8461114.1 YbjN domain-containing protein [Cytophagales bacterium]